MLLGTGPLESSPDLRETVTRLRRLVELSATLNSTLNLNEILQLIIQTAAEILDCEAASILLHDEGSTNLFFAASTGSDAEKLAEVQVPVNDSLAGTIFRTNEPLILNQIEGDARHNPQASKHVGFRTRSLLGVPMRIRTKTTGVLEALNKKDGVFTEADKNILIVVASHAAVAIHNAQLVQALRKAYETARQADQMKSDFLAVASHELRTPLGIIIGYSTFLREEAQGELSSHAKHVLDAAMQMRALVEDMTNLTLLESDEQINKRESAPAQQVLEIAFDEVQELAQAKGQAFEFDFSEEPLMVMVDIKKLSTAFANIMNNAIRFSDADAVIRVGARREADGILCWVQDKGIGLPANELTQIFERFHQVEIPNIRRYGGMGLGLTIAKGLVEAQGGKIWAESKGSGQGAVFKVLLPPA